MAQQKHTLKIKGMHCTSCAMLIDGDLEDTKGVVKATTQYAKQTTEVVFDDEEVTLEDIVTVVKNTGYEVEPPAQSKLES